MLFNKLLMRFIVNSNKRTNNSVTTSESCEMSFFRDKVTKQFNASRFNEIYEVNFF